MGNGVLGQRIKKSSILDKTQEVLMKKKKVIIFLLVPM